MYCIILLSISYTYGRYKPVVLYSSDCLNFQFPSGKLRGGQVHKTVEIHGLEVYCSTFQRTPDSMIVDLTGNSELWGNAWCEGRKNVYVLAPVDVSMSLMVSTFVFMGI